VLRVNLKGAFLVSQAAARQMVTQVKAGGAPGVIINMSSINAVVAIPNQVPYCVSKGGLDQLTKVMALSLAPFGIRVNAIGPGSIMTDMLQGVATDRDAKRRLLARTPLGRIGEPDEIAAVACFLASADASYVTGQTIWKRKVGRPKRGERLGARLGRRAEIGCALHTVECHRTPEDHGEAREVDGGVARAPRSLKQTIGAGDADVPATQTFRPEFPSKRSLHARGR
jgi:NAD(P)-dependent dehydrogenase (short-subunit alcohol dehydrogenase family)